MYSRAGRAQSLARLEKEAIVSKLTKAFEESSAVFGMQYSNINGKKLQGLRQSLRQEGAQMIIVKNTLFKIAADRVSGWSELKKAANGPNAWIFANDENLARCVKSFVDFEKTLKKDDSSAQLPYITGGVFYGQLLDHTRVLKLENMKTRVELINELAVMMKRVPLGLLLGLRQTPTVLARVMHLMSQAEENKEKLAGDAFPAKEKSI